jgi:hypothetical protein
MLKLHIMVATSLMALSFSAAPTMADFFAHHAHTYTTYVYRDFPRGCPDRYSCYSLYGAYGPYGGRAYWSEYSPGAWGYYSPLK